MDERKVQVSTCEHGQVGKMPLPRFFNALWDISTNDLSRIVKRIQAVEPEKWRMKGNKMFEGGALAEPV
jgi:hypothetical protein